MIATTAIGSPPEVKSARTIGGAGTGKTMDLLNIVDRLLSSGISHTDLGFVSFTRAARQEAAERAAKRFGLDLDELMRDGWYRTLHSVCYRVLGLRRDEVLSGDAKSRRWLMEALGQPVDGTGDALNSEDDGQEGAFEDGRSDAARSLRIWGLARNTLQSVGRVWEHVRSIDGHTPDLADVERYIENYEHAKIIDHRTDFTDMLSRFAGIHQTTSGPEDTAPEGEPPELTAWILDEAQDISALSGAVFQRLISTGACRYTYLSGDPFQSLYLFGGADSTVFRRWPVVKERIAPKSWRCPAPILALGEEVLRRCSDYFDRHIAPADHDGEILRCQIDDVIPEVHPQESWLLLTRCRFQASHVGGLLTQHNIPWLDTHGGGTWHAPKRNAATRTLMAMERGETIDALAWAQVISLLKLSHKIEGKELLVKGAKAHWARLEAAELQSYPPIVATDNEWEALGLTPKGREVIRSGYWRCLDVQIIPYADRYYQACNRYGMKRPEETTVRVGTIHSSKGMEASHVAVLRTTTERCVREMDSGPQYADAEHRVWYVAATRARKRLFICRSAMGERGREPEYPL